MCIPGLCYSQYALRLNGVLRLRIINSIFIVAVLILVIPVPIQATLSDDPVVDFSRDIDPKSMYNPARAIVEINTAESGVGVYMHIDTNISVNVHIINSSAREAILTGGRWGSVYAFVDIDDLDFQFVTPYNDTFFILIVNMNRLSAVHVNGWYAFDKTAPTIDVVYGKNDKTYWVSIDTNDRFNISKIELYREQYKIFEKVFNKSNASLDYSASITLLDEGKNYFTIKVYDIVGNVGIETFVISMPRATTTVTTPVWNVFTALLLLGIFFGVPVLVIMIIKRFVLRE